MQLSISYNKYIFNQHFNRQSIHFIRKGMRMIKNWFYFWIILILFLIGFEPSINAKEYIYFLVDKSGSMWAHND